MTINTRVIRLILEQNEQPFVEISRGHRVQVISDLELLHTCQKNQFAAFVTGPRLLIVWEDDPKKILGRASSIQQELIHMICGGDAYPILDGNERRDSGQMPPGHPESDDIELADEKPRKYVLIQPLLIAATLILLVSALGAGWRRIAIEIYVDHNFTRFLFMLTIVPQVWLSFVCPQTHFYVIYSPFVVLFPSRRRQSCSALWSCGPIEAE
jgi:hypothetical protein